MTIKTHYETLTVHQEPGVTWLTINRPKVLNALNPRVLGELTEAIDATVKAAGSRVLVLSGAGDKAFIAGADIAAMQSMTPGEALHFARIGQNLTAALEAAPFITIAKVQGFALGGGCEVAMACDIIIAAEQARFGQPEVDLGLIPGFGGTQRLVKRVGMAVAMDMLCAGRKLTGLEALQLGLASQVAPLENLDTAVQNTVKKILKAAPGALAETKRLAKQSLEMPLGSGLASEATAFAACFAGAEAKEGTSAFLEKRPASFSL